MKPPRASPRGEKGRIEFSNCACTGVNLPKLVHATILALLANGPMHGYALTDAITRQGIFGKSPPDHSGIYRLLHGMQRKGLVKPCARESVSGRWRCAYVLTASGRRCLSRWIESLMRYRATVDSVLHLCRSR